MVATVGGVAIGLSADTIEFQRDLGKAYTVLRNSTADMERRLQKTEKAFDSFSRRQAKSMEVLEGWGRAAAASVAAVAASYATSSFGTALKSLSEIGATASALGLTVEQLQELRFAAKEVGATVDTLDGSWETFIDNIGQAGQGTGDLNEVLRQHGIALRNTDGSLRSSMDLFRDLASAAQLTGDHTETTRIAIAAFGDEGLRLVPLLRQGAAGFDSMASSAHGLSQVINSETVRDAERLQREYERVLDTLTAKWQGLVVLVAKGLTGPGERDIFEREARWAEDQLEALQGRLSRARAGSFWTTAEDRSPAGIAALEKRVADAEQRARIARNNLRLLDRPAPGPLPYVPPAPTDTTTGKSTIGSTLADIRRDMANSPFGAGNDSIDYMSEFDDYITKIENGRHGAQQYKRALEEQGEALKAQLDPMYDLKLRLESVHEMYDSGAIKAGTYQAALDQIRLEALLVGDTLESGFARSLTTVEAQLGRLDWFSRDILDQVLGSFKGFVNDMINEAMRMSIWKPLFGGLLKGLTGGLGGGGGSYWESEFGSWLSGARASGGPVRAGGTYLVGERGPELFTPANSGMIIPNQAMGQLGGGGMTVHQEIHIHYDATLESMDSRIRKSAPDIAKAAAEGIRNAQQRTAGGFLR